MGGWQQTTAAARDGHRPTVLQGRETSWALLGFVAEGGSARIFRARETRGGPERALKLVKHRLVKHRQLVELFSREAEVLATLDSPHIPRMIDRSESTELPFMETELLPGRPLSAYTAWQHPLPVAWTLGVLVDVTKALMAVHEAEWVHGDVKPANGMTGRRSNQGRAHLVDFGVAAQFGDKTDQIVGTPQFYAPEGVLGADRMPANDLYALGALAFQCLTGRMPFDGDSVPEILRQQVKAPVPSPRTLNADLPASVDAIVRRLLAKEPERRGTASRLLAELQALRAALPHNAIPVPRPHRIETNLLGTGGFSFGLPSMDIPTTLPSDRELCNLG